MVEKRTPMQIVPQGTNYPAAVSGALGRKAPTLHVIGNIDLLNNPGIGFCGSRKASEKGLAVAADCAEQVARAGVTVISGNASGIDRTAHYAALKAGGTTILVIPEGTDHFRVRRDLVPVWDWDRVLVVSQFEPNAVWQAYRAMARNEVIIALSRAMIVIEAGATGGTLDAGLRTLSAGKPLFVAMYEQMDEKVPGNAQLLGNGGVAIAKSRSTGRANLERVRVAVESVQPVRQSQPALI
jgi:DNA processing protein